MSLQETEELPERKKAAIKSKATKPVADRHRPEPMFTAFMHDEVVEYVMSLDDTKLSEMQAAIALEVTGRHQRIRDELEAKAAAIGASIKWPGTRKGEALPPRYRDPNTGETWAKRGIMPNWLKVHVAAGRDIEDFSV